MVIGHRTSSSVLRGGYVYACLGVLGWHVARKMSRGLRWHFCAVCAGAYWYAHSCGLAVTWGRLFCTWHVHCCEGLRLCVSGFLVRCVSPQPCSIRAIAGLTVVLRVYVSGQGGQVWAGHSAHCPCADRPVGNYSCWAVRVAVVVIVSVVQWTRRLPVSSLGAVVG